MSDSNHDVIINRIRKILERSKDPNAPEGEVETALAMAEKLMQKYNIDEHQVLLSSDAARRTAYETITEAMAYQRANKIDQWDMTLAWVCNCVCGTKFFLRHPYATNTRGKVGPVEQIHFYGFPRDVAVAQALFMELLATMRAMARLRLGRNMDKADERSYCTGFSSRLHSRANQIKKDRDEAPAGSEEATAGAIVLAKDTLLERYAEEKHGILSRATLDRLRAEREADELAHPEKYASLVVRTSKKKAKEYKGRRSAPLTDAFHHGWNDGNNVSLDDRGIAGSSSGNNGRKEIE